MFTSFPIFTLIFVLGAEPCACQRLVLELRDVDATLNLGVIDKYAFEDEGSSSSGGELPTEAHQRFRRSAFYETGKTLANATSRTLDQLLGANYSKRVRPNFGGKPVRVRLNLSIRSMGPVSENSQSFYLDCYFRQSWTDPRLSYNVTGVQQLPMNWQFLTKIWKPDTFFLNGKKSKLHKITVPNRFLRIMPDGSISYSQRLTVHARCQMSLRKFPLDSQRCNLLIGSYGYTSDELQYYWADNALSLPSFDQLGLSQFALERYHEGITTNTTNRKLEFGFRNDSVAFINFYFERQTGFFLLQMYTPMILIVMCSWVAFWIVRTDAPARCVLGITTILSTVKLGFGGKGKPQVGYLTALDVFVLICFFCVFAALLEFAVINFITVTINRLKAEEEKRKEALEKLVKTVNEKLKSVSPPKEPVDDQQDEESKGEIGPDVEVKTVDRIDVVDVDEVNVKTSWSRALMDQLGALMKKLDIRFMTLSKLKGYFKMKPIEETYVYSHTDDVLNSIDEYARKCFPATFLILNFIYWTTYLYLYEDSHNAL